MLGPAGGRLQVHAAAVEGEVAAPQRQWFEAQVALLSRFPAGAAGGAVVAVIEPPVERVDEPLHVADAKTGEEDLLLVRPVVAVGVLEPENVRGVGDEN